MTMPMAQTNETNTNNNGGRGDISRFNPPAGTRNPIQNPGAEAPWPGAGHRSEWVSRDRANGNNGAGELVVSTEAIRYFRKQLEILAPKAPNGPIPQVTNGFATIVLKPGTFGKAALLWETAPGKTSTASQGSLSAETRALLEHVHETLYKLQVNLDDLIRESDTSSELPDLPPQVPQRSGR